MRIIIAGGGISGLSLAWLLSKNASFDVTLLEADKRIGGKIWSRKEEGGFLCEYGVNAFLDNKPRPLELCSALGLTPLRSSDSARKRYIYSDGRLQLLPESPSSFLRSGLMSVSGKLRIMMEPFIPRGRSDDETLADFARRRLGDEAFEKFIDPMASGVFAGDPEQMSLKSSFPRIAELEERYGSLIKAMIKLQMEARKNKTGEKITASPRGVLSSFGGGMEDIVRALREGLGERIRTGAKAVGLSRNKAGFTIVLSDGSRLDAECVVLATPAYETADIMRGLSQRIPSLLESIPYPPLSIVSLGYKKTRINKDLNAFGFLVPGREGRKILGTLYDSSIFPNRAPEGYALLRIMIGGARAAELALKPEGALVDIACREIAEITGIGVLPDFTKVYIHEKAIPQYTIGHYRRLNQMEELLGKFRGLYLAGNAYRGVAFNDCITNAYAKAKNITEEMG